LSDVPLHRVAYRVLRIVYELQFVGRTRAVFAGRDSQGQIILRPDESDVPFRFESVPVLALLVELYQPNQDNWQLKMTLRPAMNYLRAKGWIGLRTTPTHNEDEGGLPKEAEVVKGIFVPVEMAIPSYVRPDGVIVSGFWDIPEIDAIPAEYYPLGSARLRSWLGHTTHKVCVMFGVRVGEKPIYWVFRREREDRSGIRTDRPVKLLLGQDAAHSGYPPDENYVITENGVAEIETTDGARGGDTTEQTGKTAATIDGEWSAPMTRTEIARRITGRANARPRKVQALLDRYGLQHVSGRMYQVRLDKMESNIRKSIEKPV